MAAIIINTRPCQSAYNALIADWRGKGYDDTHTFPGEYTLMLNHKTNGKVRIYESGKVLVSNPRTGEYEECVR